MERLEQLLEWGGIKKEIIFLVVSGVCLIVSFFGTAALKFDAAWIAVILCGVPIVLEAVIGLVTRFDIKADVLVSIALIASIAIGQVFAAGEIACIMQLGALLEDLTVQRAENGIEKLVRLSPRTARVVGKNGEKVVPAEEVKVGDLIRVLPGETVPVDGVIVDGETAIDQSVMTGESLPVEKGTGDEVMSGTLNQFGAFDMKADKVGEDSAIRRLIALVQSADAGKAKIVRLADKWATWIVVAAISAAVITWIATGELLRAVTILVVFCPCALVLATPTAVVAAIGNATKHGFLVREGDALERLANVSEVAFDKTGTLTKGELTVVHVESFGCGSSDEDVYRAAAMAEVRSEHPLGRAVLRCFREIHPDPEAPEHFDMLPGLGVCAEEGGHRVLAGNEKLLETNGIVMPEEDRMRVSRFLEEGCTVMYVSIDGSPAGFLALADTARNGVRDAVAALDEAGVETVLLTGDNKRAAQHLAAQFGIENVRAECMPEEKLEFIRDAQKQGTDVCMIGDGINDAPALRQAYVGMAMGSVGSDIAVDAADIALVGDDIEEIPFLFKLARHMMKVIKANLVFSLTLNFVAIVLAITGIMGPVVGALVHNAGSVFVIANSALLLRWTPKRRQQRIARVDLHAKDVASS